MRLHALTFRGLGPYRDEQRIDFDRLGASGLYLINGPTGAGKSTIIDAICFALYGRLAGDDSDPARLRSHFCGPNDPTEVDLVFETAAGVFRVIRTPEYQRAKNRGTGETTAKTTCKLFRVRADASEEAIETQVAAANAELSRVIGLSRDQFVQTIVLPQGQFATFLNADTRDRADILKRIFNTALFEKVADVLKEDAKAARDASAGITHEILDDLRLLCSLLDLDDDERSSLEQLASDSLDASLLERLAALEPALATATAEAQAAVAAATSRATAADERRTSAKAEADAIAREEAARLAKDEAAAAVQSAREGLRAWSDLAAELSLACDDQTDPMIWRARSANAVAEGGRLSSVIDDEAAVLGWPAQREQQEARIAGLRRDQAGDEERQGQLPSEIAALDEIRQARPAASEIADLEGRATELGAADASLTALEVETARLPELEATVLTTLSSATAATAAAEAATHAYRAGVAAELALTLEPGEPCAVCGGTDHPSPAQHSGTPVPLEQVEQALRAGQSAHAAVERARENVALCRERIDQYTAALSLTREEWATAHESLAQDRKEIEQRAAAAEEAEETLASLRAEQVEITGRLAGYEATIAGLVKALAEKDAAIEALAASVALARGSFASVAERRDALGSLADALTALADRLADTARTAQEHSAAAEALAALPEHEWFADTDAAQKAWGEADAARLEAEGVHSAARQRLRHLQEHTSRISGLLERRALRVAGDADLLALAEVFSAGRGSDMGLHVYVLRAMFENVMELANRRLESLLGGRYRLVPAEVGEGDRRSLQGLGVNVLDALTGKVRPAGSLSGGEAFCASLALALGLSDAVRINAGGIEIGSLFIDEGFGSLDSDQLDEVMVMLGHLSSDGRRVGVISHVDSMKATIVERIEISPATERRPASLMASWMT